MQLPPSLPLTEGLLFVVASPLLSFKDHRFFFPESPPFLSLFDQLLLFVDSSLSPQLPFLLVRTLSCHVVRCVTHWQVTLTLARSRGARRKVTDADTAAGRGKCLTDDDYDEDALSLSLHHLLHLAHARACCLAQPLIMPHCHMIVTLYHPSFLHTPLPHPNHT